METDYESSPLENRRQKANFKSLFRASYIRDLVLHVQHIEGTVHIPRCWLKKESVATQYLDAHAQ